MDINKINQKAKQLSKVISTEVPTFDLSQPTAIEYDGSFKSIYNMVMQDKIKLLLKNGSVVGISVNSGTGSVEEDNLASYKFAEAYDSYDAMQYVNAAFILKNAGVVVDDIDESKGEIHIYLYRQGKMLDINCDVLVDVSDNNDVTLSNVRQKIDEAYAALHACEQCASDDEVEFDEELPEEVEIDEDDVIEAGSIADYLRETYGHYLAKGNEFEWDYNDDVYTVWNIKWGRKKY